MLSKEVGEILILGVIEEVGLLLEGGVPVGKGVIVGERVTGLLGVLVTLLCGERLTLGVFVVVAVCVLVAVMVTVGLVDAEGVILRVCVAVGDGLGVTYNPQHRRRVASQLLSLRPFVP